MRSCISNLPDQIFYGLAKLEELDLSGNNLVLKSSIFKDLQSLKNLKLHACGITSFAKGLFSHLSKLKKLDLSFNCFKLLNSKAFKGLGSLEKLNLCHSEITFIEEGFFANFSLSFGKF